MLRHSIGHETQNHELTAHVADKLCRLIVIALWKEKRRNREASTFFKSSMSAISPVILKALPSSSNLPASSCVNEPSKLNPCPTVCYLHVITKEQGKEKRALSKKSSQGFWRLFGKGRMFGRPFFKTNPEELSTLCIYPKQLLNNTKNVSINKILSITNFAQYFYPAT